MVPDGWTRCRLGDIVNVRHGWPFKSELYSSQSDGEPVVVSIGNFRYTGGFRFKETAIKGYLGSYPKEYELAGGDILLVMTCQTAGGEILGIPARVPKDGRVYLHNQRLGKVVPRDSQKTCLDYLYWLFLSKEFNRELVTSASGTKILHTAPSRIEAFEFWLPPLHEQRAIAHILGTLDEKIDLNRRMNETLESIARALFKSWFVDLDPVRAKAEGRDPGLPKRLADLFPDSFEDSELGDIPTGWRVGTLADFAALNPESWSKDTRPATINYVDLSNTKWGRIESVTTHTRQAAPSRAQRVLRSGDTIVGTVRPGNGSYAFVTEEKLTGSTGFAVLRPHRQEYCEYVYLTATTAENIEELAHLADGAAYPAVRPEVVAAIMSLRPTDFVLTNFANVAAALVGKIAANERESRTLATLRDTLLPKLISGELRIKPRRPNS